MGRAAARCLLNEASRLGVSFLWGELSLDELSFGRVVLFPFKIFRIAKNRKYRENVG